MLNETPNRKIERTRSAPKLFQAFGMVLVGVGLLVFGLRGVLEEKVYIKTPKMLVRAEVADEEAERVLGLSGRSGLSVGRAMLFVFEKSDMHGIWMKDMKFAIDIVWLDSNKKVVAIQSNVKPNSYPKIYGPAEKSLYVIEFATGRASELGIKVGQILTW